MHESRFYLGGAAVGKMQETLTGQRLIAEGTDWRFLNELEKELKE
jgi:hypothetical protein